MPVTLPDRLATAFVSCIAAAGTFAVFAIFAVLRGPIDELEFWNHFVFVSAVMAALAAVVGFVVGSERMAHYFGIAWGTEEPNVRQAFVLMLVILAICAYFLFG
jgi:hypothetical protein